MDVPSAPFSSRKRKRSNDGGSQDLYSGSLTALSPKPWAPHFATNLPLNGDWTKAKWTMTQPPYVPPYGKWIRAPPPDSFLAAAMGMDRPAYDPKLPPIMMPRPRPGYVADWSAPPPPPPPPYVSRYAAPPKFAPASQPWGPRPSDHTWCNKLPDHTCRNEPFDTIAMYGCRGQRQMQAAIFKNITTSPQNIKSVRKFCIQQSGASDLLGKSFGIMWVAVRGMDSMCVVTRNSDLVHLGQKVLSRGEKSDTEHFLRSFWNVLVSEVEDIEGPSGEAFNDSSVEPFGVVCVISGDNEVQKVIGSEASSVEYDADKAIKFLQEELKTDSAFTFDETVMTAILAIQHLFLQEFEADEIRVFAWKKGYVVGKELQQEREDPDVEELLASLNSPDNDPDTV